MANKRNLFEEIHYFPEVLESYIDARYKRNRGNGSMKCPFHDDAKPSMIYKTGYYRAKCQVCNKAFDLVDFIQEDERLARNDAIKRACEYCGIEYDQGFKVQDTTPQQAYRPPFKVLVTVGNNGYTVPKGKDKKDIINMGVEMNEMNAKQPVKLTLDELKKELLAGKTIRPAVVIPPKDNTRTVGTVFLEQSIFGVDIDNAHKEKGVEIVADPILTPEKAIELSTAAGYPPFLVYPTFSNKNKDYPRFRLLYVLEEPITQRQGLTFRNNFIKTLNSLFGDSADEIDDPIRLLLGTDEPDLYFNPNNIISLDFDTAAGVIKPTSQDKVFASLITDDKGKVKSNRSNLETILETDERLAGALAYDDFTKIPFVKKALPWNKETDRQWTPLDDAYNKSFLEKNYGYTVQKDSYNDTLLITTRKNTFNPVTELFEKLYQDFQSKHKDNPKGFVAKFMKAYWGVDPKPEQVEIFKVWLWGLIERAYHPGCKFDYVLVLIGGQGKGKSTAIRKLALNDAWFTDTLGKISDGSKGASENIMGKLVIEVAENTSFKNAAADESKAFITRQFDRYREPYATLSTDHPRTCVFASTTNNHDFLFDNTGNRRYLPIDIDDENITGDIFSNKADQDIKNLYGEVLTEYKAGNYRLYLSSDAQRFANDQQKHHEKDNPIRDDVAAWLEEEEPEKVCNELVMDKVFHIKKSDTIYNDRLATYQKDIRAAIEQNGNYIKSNDSMYFSGYSKSKGYKRRTFVQSSLKIVS